MWTLAQRGAVVLSAVVFAAPALAQDAHETKAADAAKGTDGGAAKDKRQPSGLMLVPSERVIGASVLGSGGEAIGNVRDLIIVRSTGRLAYALVGSGGIAGIGEKVTAVPYGVLHWDDQKRAMTAPITPEKFKAAPAVEENQWRSLGDTSRMDEIYKYFDAPALSNKPVADSHRGISVKPVSESPAEWRILRVSDLKGQALMSDDARKLGQISEVVFDRPTGRVAMVVVKFQEALGGPMERAPLPWTVFNVNNEGDLYTVKVDKELVMSSPRITPSTWLELDEHGFGEKVYKHYGESASWLSGPIMFGAGAEKIDPAADAAYRRAFSDGSSKTLSGAVTSVTEAAPIQGLPKELSMELQLEDSSSILVHLGPKGYLDDKGMTIAPGDHVTVSGRWVRLDGGRRFIATQATDSRGQTLLLRDGFGIAAWNGR